MSKRTISKNMKKTRSTRFKQGVKAMFESLQVRNFRGFNELKIDQLSDINLIAGKNNVGKTSLLEAVFLLTGSGNAQMAVNVNIIRGLDTISVPPGEPLWKQLFSNLDMGQSIEIEGNHTAQGLLSLKIESERQATTGISLDRTTGISVTNLFDGSLIFLYSCRSKKPVKSRIYMEGQEVKVDQPVINAPFQAVILSSRTRSTPDDAMRLGRLRRQKRGDLLLKALQVVEPRLLSIEDNSSSGIPMIWGDIGWPELVPMAVMGEGMIQIARLVLAIASVPGGVVLVDEIENGIHHSVLPDFWRVIAEAARQFHTQIFATTHSLECVNAAHTSLSPDNFRLHRLEIADKKNRCVTYEPDAIDAAIGHSLEVR